MSWAACSASCIFWVNFSIRMLQHSNRISVGNHSANAEEAFDTKASTPLSVARERGIKVNESQGARRFAARPVPPLHHWQRNLRYRHVDADNGTRLGHEHTHQQSAPARDGELRCRSADARAHDGGWLGC